MGFYGDLIKILAHTGLQTGGNILTQAIAGPMIADRAMQQEEFKTMLQAAGTAPEEAMPAISNRIKELTGRGLPTYTKDTPTGSLLTPEKDLLQKGTFSVLNPKLAATQGFTPELQPKEVYIKPRVSTDQVLAGMIGNDPNAAMTNPMVRAKLGLDKWDITPYQREQLALREKGITQTGELTRATQDATATQREEANAIRRDQLNQQLQFHREKLDQQHKMFGLLSKKLGDANLGKFSNELGKAYDDIKQIERDYPGDVEKLTPGITRYNQMVDAFEQATPDYAGHFTKFEPEYGKTWGEWWKNQPGTKVKSYKPGTPNATPKASTRPTPPSLPESIQVEGGMATKTSQFSATTGKPLYKFPDGTLRPYLGAK